MSLWGVKHLELCLWCVSLVTINSVSTPRCDWMYWRGTSELLSSAPCHQGITTASPPPPTTPRRAVTLRGQLPPGPSPLSTWTRGAPPRSSSLSATLQDVASRPSGEPTTFFFCVCQGSWNLELIFCVSAFLLQCPQPNQGCRIK